ncbi:hypothetical protein MYP_404 [Sporocytophaga myxococcoides]|uniref:Uncharacterized protein n=1 Tax=Sporocytophaga myxococcoides TaxID=153721 RepID=A0A098LA04_9BACT|nr:DUF6208 family protein [Sporocytophaga myxococcoides]GAL83178.1 hypothetical protein MYP_404 [Sporocytophaga myxococcoides]
MSINYFKYKASYIFNRLLKAYFRMLFQTLLLKKESKIWKLYIERLQHPLGIPYAMLNAPRWNTHAFIASAGPVTINESITIDFSEVNMLCSSWTFILYKLPANVTSKVISCLDDSTLCHKVNVERGSYSVVLRCYELKYPVELPELIIDNGKVVIEKRLLLNKTPVYPDTIMTKESKFYSFVHYYLHYAFRYGKRSINRNLEFEYLPVGNPETTFLFGYYNRNSIVYVDILDRAGSFLIFITCYNESSFPVYSEKIPVYGIDLYKSALLPANGTYLIRIIPLVKGLTSEMLKKCVKVNVVEGIPDMNAGNVKKVAVQK